MPRIRLLATCQINGAVHHAGELVWLPDGQRGPHRTVVGSNHGAQIAVNRYPGENDADASYVNNQTLVDEPLYVVVNEGIENERQEMRDRHLKERAELDRAPERDALVAKQAKEEADFELKAAEVNLKERQEREDEALKRRQEGEVTAFDKRAEAAPAAPAPHETDKEALDHRHNAEIEAQKAKHDAERKTLDARKEQVAHAASEPEPDPVERNVGPRQEGLRYQIPDAQHEVPVQVATDPHDHVVVHETVLSEPQVQ